MKVRQKPRQNIFMSKDTYPVTAAIRVLRAHKVPFKPCFYTYEAHGGTAVSARELGVPEHHVIKTLVMENDEKKPLIVLIDLPLIFRLPMDLPHAAFFCSS